MSKISITNDFEPKIVAFVHAKSSSERVPSKNMKILGDRPLFCHAVQHALDSKMVDAVVIDSDSDEILRIGSEMGAIPLKRPGNLANNSTTGDDLAYWQASNFSRSTIVLQVIPTSPFLKPESIDAAVKMLLDNPEKHSVVGVYEEALYQWVDGRPIYFNLDGSIPNSNVMKKIVYETTGLYINYTEFVLSNRKRMDYRSCLPYFLSKIESVDINTPDDFEFAECLWRGLNAKL